MMVPRNREQQITIGGTRGFKAIAIEFKMMDEVPWDY